MEFRKALLLKQCPHCGAANAHFEYPTRGSGNGAVLPWLTQAGTDGATRPWAVYVCAGCGGCILAQGEQYVQPRGTNFSTEFEAGSLKIATLHPDIPSVEQELPERARAYLLQALSSLHAPDGAVMLAASAVDAMFKEVGLKKGALYARVEQAQKEGRITAEMAAWAHQVRLDANDPRHADEETPHHDIASARRAVDFARALGEYLFVLPKRVTRGIAAAHGSSVAGP